MWLNGSLVEDNSAAGLGTMTDVSTFDTPVLVIGEDTEPTLATSNGFQGYIDSVRIVKGGLRYTVGAASIPVPTSPLS